MTQTSLDPRHNGLGRDTFRHRGTGKLDVGVLLPVVISQLCGFGGHVAFLPTATPLSSLRTACDMRGKAREGRVICSGWLFGCIGVVPCCG